MCCYNKLSFTLQQPLRPYLREETQGMSGVCTQQWECLLQPSQSLLQVRPRCARIFWSQLLPHLSTERTRKGMALTRVLSIQKLPQGSKVPAPSMYHRLPQPWKTHLWPVVLGTTKTNSSFPSSCISALQPYVLDAWQMKIRDLPSRVYKSPTEGMNKLNFRKKLVIFKNWVNTGKVAKLHEEILTKKSREKPILYYYLFRQSEIEIAKCTTKC